MDVRGTRGDKIGKFHYDGDRPERWTARRHHDERTARRPGFAGIPPHDFRLRGDSPTFALGFQLIPVDEIGLRRPESTSGNPRRLTVPADCPRRGHAG